MFQKYLRSKKTQTASPKLCLCSHRPILKKKKKGFASVRNAFRLNKQALPTFHNRMSRESSPEDVPLSSEAVQPLPSISPFHHPWEDGNCFCSCCHLVPKWLPHHIPIAEPIASEDRQSYHDRGTSQDSPQGSGRVYPP